jgi:heme exporter protein A
VREDCNLFAPIDFDLAAGGLVVLEGRNGAGKTTLLRALLGLCPLQAERLDFQGWDVRADRQRLGAASHFVGHLLALKGDLSVAENIRYSLWIGGDSFPADIDALCETVGLAGYEHTPVRALSAGQRKRVVLARLAASRRPLWLLDEPFANLDREGMALVERLLAGHLAAGGGAILSSHGVLPIGHPAERVRLQADP